MKRFSTLLLTAALVFTCAACGSEGDSQGSSDVNSEVQDSSEASTEEESEAQDSSEAGEEGDAEGSEAGTEGAEGTEAKSEGVMTYAEYDAAALESEVVIETYVQAKQSWWEDKATVYTQDKDGAYFVYSSEEDYEKLVPFTPRTRTALISCTTWSAPKRTTRSWFPAPRSRSQAIRPSGPVRWRLLRELPLKSWRGTT